MKEKFENWNKVDKGGMINLLVNFHDQLRKGVEIGEKADIGFLKDFNPQCIVLCGMGGSAIGGDFLRCYLVDQLKIPFIVVRDYNLPNFVSEKTLLIVSSYSGNTEETLSALDEGIKCGCKILGISSNGMIETICFKNGFPFIKIPSGIPPRAALGYSFTPLLVFLHRMGLISDMKEDILRAADFLAKNVTNFLPEIDEPVNLAKVIAASLYGKLPIIYTTTRYFEVVGLRMRGQISENSKMLAFSSVIPENNHNELVGWNLLWGLVDIIKPVIILDKYDHPRNLFRVKFFAEIMKEKGVAPLFVETQGESMLERILSVIQLGDFVSYYLAILNGIDPKPVEIIDRLKRSLAEYKG